MKEQQQDEFLNNQSRFIFDILTNKLHFQPKPHTPEDFTVDLVIRLKVPNHINNTKSKEINFDELFINTPTYFEDTYLMVQQYIQFLGESETDDKFNLLNFIGDLKSLHPLDTPRAKEKPLLLDDLNQQQLVIDCEYECKPQLDSFTIKYNMIMIVLQHLCGFQVKSYLFNQEKDTYLYMLLSQSQDNLLALANHYKIKKEVNMIEYDFFLNDPVDKKGRPLKIHSHFQDKHLDFSPNDYYKQITRSLDIQCHYPHRMIHQEEPLQQDQIDRYLAYSEEEHQALQDILKNQNMKISPQQMQYIFYCNRGKTNDGCYQYMKTLKRRLVFFNKIKELNKKYGYKTYEQNHSFFEFTLLSKRKAFFDKIAHLLTYKQIMKSPFGEISIFSKMERIKLSYLYLKQYLKVQNFPKAHLQILAINDNYQKFGNVTFEYSENIFNNKLAKENLKGIRLVDVWHGFIPFMSDIRGIYDYMGQTFAYMMLVKIHLINFFSGMSPFSTLGYIIKQIYFTASSTQIFQFSIIYLLIMIISLTIFMETWRNKENQFFNNFVEKKEEVNFRDQYKGPYFRNLITDEPNEFKVQPTIWILTIKFLTMLGLCSLIILEAVFFYGLRQSIVKSYNKFPSLNSQYLSIPHLIFYGVFFWSNYLIFKLIFGRIIIKLVQLQNYPTLEQHREELQKYIYLFTFGVQMIGPFFFYVIQPFQSNSCYADQCIQQFWRYIYARYFIIFSFILVKILYAILFYFKGGLQEITSILDEDYHKAKAYISYHDKLNRLLEFVRSEYNKEEALSLYYFCLYSMSFPFCSVLAMGLLLINYIMDRIQILRSGRRPIPKSHDLTKLSTIYTYIIHICIIVNSWALCNSYHFVQYKMTYIIEQFLTEITEENILILKILLAACCIVFLQAIHLIFKRIFDGMELNQLNNRNIKKYHDYLFRNKAMPVDKQEQVKSVPVKTIFRTYNLETLVEYKKKKISKMRMIEMTQSRYLNNPNFNAMSLARKSAKLEAKQENNEAQSAIQIKISRISQQSSL